ncbi:unnamed protein product [Cochlearia groenlandica]
MALIPNDAEMTKGRISKVVEGIILDFDELAKHKPKPVKCLFYLLCSRSCHWSNGYLQRILLIILAALDVLIKS